MNHRLARIGPVAVLAATGLLSVVPPASANTVTIGSSLGRPSSKTTKKKKGKVLNQSVAPGSTAAPGTSVDLKIAGLRKKEKG